MFSSKVKHRLVDMNLSERRLSALLGLTQPALNTKILRDDFKESTMREIADALGCDLVIDLVPRDGSDTMYSSYTQEDWLELIRGRKKIKVTG